MNNLNILFKKILIPVDSSHSSLHAEEMVVPIAKTFNSEVTVLHTVPNEFVQIITHASNLPKSVANELRASLEQKGQQIISNAHALYSEENISVQTKLIEYGNPAESILDLCGNFDLIIMGGRGDGDTEEYELGSVANKIVRHSKCPVLLLKRRAQLSKILVPIDGSEYSKKAMMYAAALAKVENAEITLLNVLKHSSPTIKQNDMQNVSQTLLDSEKQMMESYNVTSKTRIEFGSPAKVITAIADNEKYDLIILGSRGQGGIRRFLLGGVSDKVAHIAKTSILIVK